MSDWNDEFDAFDIDLSAKTKLADEEVHHKGANVSGADSESTTTDAAHSSTLASLADVDVPQLNTNEKEDEDEDAREAKAEEDTRIRQEEREQQRAARRKERQEKHQQLPKPAPQPPTEDELKQVADELGQRTLALKAMVIQLKKQLANACNHRTKGIKSAIHRLENSSEVLLATQSIVSTVAQTGYPAAFDALESSRLLKDISQTKRAMERIEPKIAASIGELKQALEAGDDNASGIARELKQIAMKLERNMQDLATTLHQATNNYPDRYGQLELFTLVAKQGDEEVMKHIDRAMQIAGQVVVHVADAPSMIEALNTNDEQAIDSIMRRAIDSFPNS